MCGMTLLGLRLLIEVLMRKKIVNLFLFVLFFCMAAGCFFACSTPVQKLQLKEEETTEEDEVEEEEVEPDPKKLTLMIYMAADNDLETYALQNLKAMERADYDFEAMNVLVLLDRAEGYDETDGNWTDTRLFEVLKDSGQSSMIQSKRLECLPLGLSLTDTTELDMANPNVLKMFIEFCRAEYEAENYCLIIWGHGTGWRGVTVDDRSGNYMSVCDMGKALCNQNLCVIGFDTCFGGVLENVYELKNCASYTVACPGVTPGGGWNYKDLLELCLQEDSQQEASLQESTALGFAKAMAQSSSVPVTIFKNENLASFMRSFEAFSHALSETIITVSDKQTIFNRLFSLRSYSYSQYPCDMYLDIPSIAEFYSEDQNAAVAQAAVNLKNEFLETIIQMQGSEGGASGTSGTTSSSSTSNTAGIGIHFIPMASARTAMATHSSDYLKNTGRTDQCAFIKESQWWVPTISGNTGSLLDKLFY